MHLGRKLPKMVWWQLAAVRNKSESAAHASHDVEDVVVVTVRVRVGVRVIVCRHVSEGKMPVKMFDLEIKISR